MAVKLIVAPEAELDVSEAYAWYEMRRAGLGEDFVSSVEACINRICPQPLSYPVVHETYRRPLVRRFPYAIFFEYEEPVATIYGVFHNSRNPDKWRQRLP